MMKLSPIRYGGTIAPVVPFGCWLTTESNLSTTREWAYDFSSSVTPFSTGYPIYFWYHAYGRYYRTSPSDGVDHILDTQLLTNNFTTETGFNPSAGGGDLIFGDPDYVFMCAGVNPINRMDAPFGPGSSPTADSQSRANTGVYLDGVIYVASIYNQHITYSSDSGVTWATKANPFASVASGATNAMHLKKTPAGNLVIAFQNGFFEAYEIKIGLSNDLGDTWTYASHTIPVPLGAGSYLLFFGGLLQSGDKLFYITSDGNCGVSYDSGATWTAKTQIPYDAQCATIGGDKILVGCGYNRAYESSDDGDSWSLVTLTSAPTGNISDVVLVAYLDACSNP